MDADAAARAWVEAWSRGWLAHDPEPIAAVYAGDAVFRSQPFRDPHRGADGARRYAVWAFEEEDAVECRFGEPIVSGRRAAVEYWAVITSGGNEETLFGTAVLRFGADGKVVEQRDTWNMQPGRREPPPDWGR